MEAWPLLYCHLLETLMSYWKSGYWSPKFYWVWLLENVWCFLITPAWHLWLLRHAPQEEDEGGGGAGEGVATPFQQCTVILEWVCFMWSVALLLRAGWQLTSLLSHNVLVTLFGEISCENLKSHEWLYSCFVHIFFYVFQTDDKGQKMFLIMVLKLHIV